MAVPEEGLSGLRVLVTGGSRGLGAATARRFADAGAKVLTASRTAPPEDFPATFIPADLSDEQGVAELGRRVIDTVGGVDVLVNNAGSTTGAMPTLQRSDESWLSDLGMNLLSAVPPGPGAGAGDGGAGLRCGRPRLVDREQTAAVVRGAVRGGEGGAQRLQP